MAGHVSSVRAAEQIEKKITTTVKDAASKHRDPRTGLVQQGPSEMVVTATSNGAQQASTPSPPRFPNSSSDQPNGNGQSQKHQSTPPPSNNQHQSSNAVESFVNGRLNLFVKNESYTPPVLQQQSVGSSRVTLSNRPSKSEFLHNSIVDSGYGSLDKLKLSSDGNVAATSTVTRAMSPMANPSQQHSRRYTSPVLSKRSTSIKSSNVEYLKNSDKKLANQISFTSDDEDGNSDRGSSGFVHLVGASSTSMKDTAYDRVAKLNKKK